MSFLRARQRVVTALTPHNGNMRWLVPGKRVVHPPVFSGPIVDQAWQVAVPVSLDVSAFFEGDPVITYAIVAGALATGLTLSAAGLITGTPTIVESGSFTVGGSNPYGSTTSNAIGFTVIL